MKLRARVPSLPAVLVSILLSVLAAPRAAAQGPLAERDVPEPLRPWVGWVLRGHEAERCPGFTGQPERRACVWPARLSIEADAADGRFAQEWQVYVDGLVPLPGDERTWPQDVRVDDAPAPVVSRDGIPSVRLGPGARRVSGRFVWDAPPALLRVPPDVGLVALRVRGEAVPFPKRDEDGRLWLERRAGTGAEEDRAELRVARLVRDDVPLELETRLDLQVAGRSREVAVADALLSGFVPVSLDGLLPGRFEKDGSLVLQARAGRWQIVVRARHEGPVAEIALPAAPAGAPAPTPGEPTPLGVTERLADAHETWAFEARPELRQATVEGVPAVDPEQTLLPPEWRSLPAFLVERGATLRLVEKRRGDADPAPDQLSLRRTWWLDFDGGGYTVHDEIGGVLTRSWRLDVGPGLALGRVAVDGRDQLVTRLPGAEVAGVEVRQGRARIEADGRMDGVRARTPAVGWSHDFADVAGQLHLPPGWRLVHARGVDDASPTWIASWSLLDLFLVLVAALAVGRLFGPAFGGVALATLALTWTEPGAPQWVWLSALATEALARVLPAGRALGVARAARLAALVALVIVVVPFLVGQVRGALYPGLAPTPSGVASGYEAPPAAEMLAGASAPESVPAEQRLEGVVREGPAAEALAAPAREKERVRRYVDSGRLSSGTYGRDRYAPDPTAQVTTGPGLPTWQWQTVALRWRGPVQSGQELSLWLVGPRAGFALAGVRVALVALLVVCFLRGIARGRLPRAPGEGGAGRLPVALLLLALAPGLTLPGVARAEFPPEALLDDLRARLLAAPECTPACASIPRLRVEGGPDALRARLEVDVAAETAVPLPGSASGWAAERVLLDGQPARALRRDPEGPLWIALPSGRHQIVMEGPLPDRESVEIPLPLRPHRIEAPVAGLQGWRVEGVGEDGAAGENLQLVRTERAEGGPAQDAPAELPPFVRVERRLDLALDWQTTTRVVRLTPPGVAIVLSVPLLAGESVTTDGVRVGGGRVAVSLGPQMMETAWTATLAPSDAIALRAAEGVPWSESWSVDASPVWHVEAEGIPTIHAGGAEEGRTRAWRPWPGEEVRLAITRPTGVPGPTLTVDRAALAVSPGLRATDATLELVLRSSRGGQHVVTLPEGAVLQQVQIDGAPQPIRLDGRTVSLPIVPGRQTATLTWQAPQGITSRFRTPEVDVGTRVVNASLAVTMPADRWTLFVFGPMLGPAVLFWSALLVVALVAVGLGRLRTTPLRWQHWLLLGIGLTQVPVTVGALVAGWLLALGARRERGAALGDGAFRLTQIVLAAWTAAALAGLFLAIQQGLLGLPEMQIRGNGSSALDLRWYEDRAGPPLPTALVVSVPLLVYRAAMLAWALWLALALLGWLRFGWAAFSEGGLWRPFRRRVREPKAG